MGIELSSESKESTGGARASTTEESNATSSSSMASSSFLGPLVLMLGCTLPGFSFDDDDDEPLRGKDAAALDAFATPPHPLDGVPATYDQATNMDFHRQQQAQQMQESERVFLRECVLICQLRSPPVLILPQEAGRGVGRANVVKGGG